MTPDHGPATRASPGIFGDVVRPRPVSAGSRRRRVAVKRRAACQVASAALVAPHAGLRYSGHIAAWSYQPLAGLALDAVVLIGPSHYAAFAGCAMLRRGSLATPWDALPVHAAIADALADASPLLAEERPRRPCRRALARTASAAAGPRAAWRRRRADSRGRALARRRRRARRRPRACDGGPPRRARRQQRFVALPSARRGAASR